MADKESNIPQHHIEFCKAVAKLAAAHGLSSMGMTFRPGYQDDWCDQIQMNWDQGRHGDSRHRLTVSSTVNLTTTFDVTAAAQPQPKEGGAA